MTTATLTESATEAEVLRCIPDSDLQELDAILSSRDDDRWRAGDIARKWIDNYGLPVGKCCKIVGKRVDYGHERVRQLLYTSQYYYRSELRQLYDLLAHSYFEHARKYSNPAEALRVALEEQLSLADFKERFPPVATELQELLGRIPAKNKAEADTLTNTYIGKMKELL